MEDKIGYFFAQTIERPDGCWEWIGYCMPQGYGRFMQQMAHRVSYDLFIGNVPDGFDLDHTCHTLDCPGGRDCPHRRCVNPYHLEAVTRQTNLSRGHHNNRGRTHCRRGHEFKEGSYWLTTKGSRQCMACVKLRNKGPKIYTHCKNGHPFDHRNKKQQICRICARARNRAYKIRLKNKP